MRAAIIIPLPEHASRGLNNELLSVNSPALRVPDLQDFFFIEMENEAITLGFSPYNGMPIVMGSAEPDAPEAQSAAMNVRQESLHVRRDFCRTVGTRNGFILPRRQT